MADDVNTMVWDLSDPMAIPDWLAQQQIAEETATAQGWNYNPTTKSWTDQSGNPVSLPGDQSNISKIFSSLGSLFSGKSSLGTTGQVAGIVGLAGVLNSLFGKSGGSGVGYTGGIPQYTATRTMNPIPTTVTNAANQTVPRRPGSGGITYFSPMVYSPYTGTAATDSTTVTPGTTAAPTTNPDIVTSPPAIARGGLIGMASGGITSLVGYSDGGQLLRGPGDGVSDNIPAIIGRRQPARLADGEFVVPARIVSELGNGSTEAGARKLYAMMDRVKKSRMKSNRDIAADTKADRNLPA